MWLLCCVDRTLVFLDASLFDELSRWLESDWIFLWFPGGLDLHRPALWGYEDRHCPLHKKQGEDEACSSDWRPDHLLHDLSLLSLVRTRTSWAQRSASQQGTSRIYTQTPADSLETDTSDPNLWRRWRPVRFRSLSGWSADVPILVKVTTCVTWIVILILFHKESPAACDFTVKYRNASYEVRKSFSFNRTAWH